MNFVSRITAGRGMVSRSERTTRSCSASTISALPSMTRRSARRMGTMVRGSNDAFSARQPRITEFLQALLPYFKLWPCNSPNKRAHPCDARATASSAPRSRRRYDGGAHAFRCRGPVAQSVRCALHAARERRIRIEEHGIAHERAAGHGDEGCRRARECEDGRSDRILRRATRARAECECREISRLSHLERADFPLESESTGRATRCEVEGACSRKGVDPPFARQGEEQCHARLVEQIHAVVARDGVGAQPDVD